MRDRRTRTVVLAGVVLAAAAGAAGPAARPARAQTLETPRSRQGYYLAVGGYGVANQSWDDGQALAVAAGGAGSFRMGQLLTRRLGLGLNIDFGNSKRGARTAQLGGISLEGQWELGWSLAVRGGVGLSVVVLDDEDDPDAGSTGGVGSGYFLAVGYDWFPFRSRLTGGFAVTPVLQARFTPIDGTRALVGTFGVEITYWTGLPRNQLELPEADAYERR